MLMQPRFDWVTARRDCRADRVFGGLWREASADVETANALLGRGGVERPFSVEPAPQEGQMPPRETFIVSRKQPDGSVDKVVFAVRHGHIHATGYGHRVPMTADLWLDQDDGLCKATIRYEEDGYELACCSEAPWQMLARALGPLFFAKPGRVMPNAAAG